MDTRQVLAPLAACSLVLGMGALASPAGAGGRPLTAELSGENEVPPSGSPATGSAALTLNQGQGRICWEIELTDLEGTWTAAHIHAAPVGANGGVVVGLKPQATGCAEDVDKTLIKDIRQNPADYYVNVHTTVVPSGEVRGQLSQ